MRFTKHLGLTLLICSIFLFSLAAEGIKEQGSTGATAQGITISEGIHNPNGAFSNVFIVRKTPGISNIPEKLTNTPFLRPSVKLTVFHINDLHGHITDQNKTKGDTHRVSQMVSLITKERSNEKTNEVVLFVSAGDEHTGTPFDELSGWSTQEYKKDPAYEVLGKAGLDVSVIGNHEVDRDYDMAAYAIEKDASFPVVSANIAKSAFLNNKTISPAIIGIANGLRIGIIGLTTPDETKEHTAKDPQAEITAPLQALDYYIPKMENYVDVFILLDHLGNEADTRHHVSVGDQAVAKRAAELSSKPILVIGGHTHSELNKDGLDNKNVIDGVLVAQAGSYGQYLGKIQIQLEQKLGIYTEAAKEAQLIPIKTRDDRIKPGSTAFNSMEHDSDYDIAFERAVVNPILSLVSEKMEQPLAKVSNDPSFSTEQVLAQRYLGECGMANYMNDLIVTQSKNFPGGVVDFAAFNASGLAKGVNSLSEVTYGAWFSVMPYADNIVVFELTGREIQELLQSNAKRLVRPEELIGPGKANLEDFISRGFLHFSEGIRYTIYLGSEASKATAKQITLKGLPIDEVLDKTYRVAFSSYIASGFEGWKGNTIGSGLDESIKGWDLARFDKLDTGLVYRNEIISAIREKGTIGPKDPTRTLLDGRVAVKP
ncbi:bifunctional UDP-sugar hydrolase/5'-nucleotidase [uncultured Sphaerochaeta sp.]|uniref:bifunctional metallophosphatase/5'-nucleotidase n=1 Tax=uncultured Sphaerochaeta sp. TaxID=886478 RepID=UPI002A0A403D|nr:bifunctional UDP-sugar hydrolase/5'-nucleotidase [uncultured Sphaerochaeta sp.]